jgi:hypothetical protein
MPTIHELKSTKFLTKELVGKGMLLTIKGWHEDTVGVPPEPKTCLDFEETDKPLVMNNTKFDVVAQICGSDEINEWNGYRIVCFLDPTIENRGKVVGGIGVRAPRIAPAPSPPGPRPSAPKPAPARPAPVPVSVAEDAEPPEAEESDVPF